MAGGTLPSQWRLLIEQVEDAAAFLPVPCEGSALRGERGLRLGGILAVYLHLRDQIFLTHNLDFAMSNLLFE